MLRIHVTMLLSLVATSACERGVVSSGADAVPGSVKVRLSSVVTPALRAQVTDEGRFLRSPLTPATHDRIDASMARDLASAYIRTAGSQLRPGFEITYGSKIDFTSLVAGEPIVIDPPYEYKGDLPLAIQRLFARWYVVPLLGRDGDVVIVTAVSELNRDLRIMNDRIVWPIETGNNFYSSAPNPASRTVWSPEDAATRVYELTGIRIASIPRPVNPGHRRAPTNVLWEVELENPLTFISAEGAGVSRLVYYTVKGGLAIGRATDAPRTIPYADREVPIQRGRAARKIKNITATPAPGVPTRFVEITQVRPQ